MPVSVADLRDWQRRARSFASISGCTWIDSESIAITGADGAQRISGVAVLPAVFETLGSRPLLGGSFLPQEYFGASRVVLLGYQICRERFGGAADLVGRPVRINREAYAVVGILPADFELPVLTNAAQILVPFRLDSPDGVTRTQRLITAFGRLNPGYTISDAQSEMGVIAATLASEHPEDANHGIRTAAPRDSEGLNNARAELPVFLATVALMLLIAAANVAGVLLSRFAARRGELVIRTALGASRRRLIRQLTTEALVIAGLAGALRLIVALWVADLVVSFRPFYIPFPFTVRLDAGAVVIVGTPSIAAGVAFGPLPALTVTRTNLHELVNRATARVTGGWQDGLRNALVIAEVAMSVALLVGAVLMMETMWRIAHVPVGFDPNGIAVGRVSLDPARYRAPQAQRRAVRHPRCRTRWCRSSRPDTSRRCGRLSAAAPSSAAAKPCP